jgi:hypothetical protein
VIVVQVNGAVPKAPQLEKAADVPPPIPSVRSPAGAIWIAAGACLAILAYSVVNQYWLGAIVSGVGFVAAAAAGMAFRATHVGACPPIGSIGGPYGNGPYRRIQCAPNGKVVAALGEIAAKLRELPAKETGDGRVNWNAFDAACAAAKVATERGDYVVSVREFCSAIRGIMKQLRDLRIPGCVTTAQFDQ